MFFGPVPSSTQLPFANQLLDSYITFVTHLNPGPAWPMYTKNKANVLQLIQGNVALIPDGVYSRFSLSLPAWTLMMMGCRL